MPRSDIFVLSQNVESEQPRTGNGKINSYQVSVEMKTKGGKNVRIRMKNLFFET